MVKVRSNPTGVNMRVKLVGRVTLSSCVEVQGREKNHLEIFIVSSSRFFFVYMLFTIYILSRMKGL